MKCVKKIFQLCISPSGKFNDIIWATVSERDEVSLFHFPPKKYFKKSIGVIKYQKYYNLKNCIGKKIFEYYFLLKLKIL